MCVHICMCMYLYMYVYVYIYIYIHTHIHTEQHKRGKEAKEMKGTAFLYFAGIRFVNLESENYDVYDNT